MHLPLKRAYESGSDSESASTSDETWSPAGTASDDEGLPANVCTRSQGPAPREGCVADAERVMDLADEVVDNESDFTTTTDEEEEESSESETDEGTEEDDTDDTKYSDDDSFVESEEGESTDEAIVPP